MYVEKVNLVSILVTRRNENCRKIRSFVPLGETGDSSDKLLFLPPAQQIPFSIYLRFNVIGSAGTWGISFRIRNTSGNTGNTKVFLIALSRANVTTESRNPLFFFPENIFLIFLVLSPDSVKTKDDNLYFCFLREIDLSKDYLV